MQDLPRDLHRNKRDNLLSATYTLALVAEGDRISSLTRAKGHKEDTILDWLKAAGDHAEAVEAVLLADYRLERGQIDGLWAYVGHKGEKKAMKKRLKAGSFGGQR